jgi:hypothetical protein
LALLQISAATFRNTRIDNVPAAEMWRDQHRAVMSFLMHDPALTVTDELRLSRRRTTCNLDNTRADTSCRSLREYTHVSVRTHESRIR